jgi:hypothetical protein
LLPYNPGGRGDLDEYKTYSQLPVLACARWESCSSCGAVITVQETSYELVVIPGGRIAPQELRFHIDCHTAWVFACKERPHGQVE